jgi:hypothetical protein
MSEQGEKTMTIPATAKLFWRHLRQSQSRAIYSGKDGLEVAISGVKIMNNIATVGA